MKGDKAENSPIRRAFLGRSICPNRSPTKLVKSPSDNGLRRISTNGKTTSSTISDGVSHHPNTSKPLVVCQGAFFGVIIVMRTFLNKGLISVVVLLLISLTGCALFSNPLRDFQKAAAKVEVNQQKIENNKDKIIDQGGKYAFATQVVLDADPTTNLYTQVASGLNKKTILTLGMPSVADANTLTTMSERLVSSDTNQVNLGKKQLALLDAQIITLQKDKEALEVALTKSQDKFNIVSEANAGLANKWSKVVKVFWWIIYGLIAVVIVKVLSAVLPPPYNTIVGIVAAPLGLIVKGIQGAIPEVKTFAGVVHKDYQTATEDLITVINKLKEKHPDIHQDISKEVYNNTDSTTSARVINQTKNDMGLVS
jgi:hypothetical protein